MPEKIDVIAPPLDECASFVVNNLVDSVVLSNGVADYYGQNAQTQNKFYKGDSLILISAGIILPENFTFWKLGTVPLPSIRIKPIGAVSGHPFFNPNFSGSLSYIPMENYESIFDSYMDCQDTYDSIDASKTLLDEDYYLQLFVYEDVNISMKGVPDSLNGKTFRAIPFIKVFHTLSMQ